MKTEGVHLGGTNNLPKVDVHPRVTIHQMPVVRFSILELHELRSQMIQRLEPTEPKPSITQQNYQRKAKRGTRI
jgi:hypothetical protein